MEQLLNLEGLEFLGICSPKTPDAFEQFERWLGEGRHGEMRFLERHTELRAEPARLLPGSRTAILFALGYDQREKLPVAGPVVAQYARIRDYHKLLRQSGERIALTLKTHYPGAEARVFVDSAPILERALAAQTERGFIGKNTCYIHPELGSFVLLAGILTSIDFEKDIPSRINPGVHLPEGGCGACRECQKICPTGALDTDYSIDSRRCLAYWTIEHRGTIPEQYWPWLSTYYFGCDLCQLACPYNLKKDKGYLPSHIPVRQYPDLFATATMDQSTYEYHFGGTPLTRAKREGLRRNALIAMAVIEHSQLQAALEICEMDGAPVLKETVRQIVKWREKHAS
ncbi:MAG: tRNA epoxyqueuosine(34) reductase QueG [Bdellovibrionales bacterium]|nr:tRNA epoxyqueuosine(34) reductase QueG [Bdellovibrionales bacterium]